MKETHRDRAAAPGTIVGAVVFGALLASCAPGKLPCDKDEQWRAICADPGTGMGGAGGMGGGGGMGGAPMAVTAATTIDCAMYPTVGDMDKFFAARCGLDNNCHATPTFKDLKSANVFSRLKTGATLAKSAVYCGGSDVIDTADWQKSILWVATRVPKANCPGQGTIIRTMPPQEPANVMPKEPPLTADENACLEKYLKAIAGVP
jgi:hypothetical protein